MSSERNPWTPIEDAMLKDLSAAGIKPCSIAKRLGRNESSVYQRLESIGYANSSRTKKRNCMCCKREFNSVGPHNRLCTKCRTKETTPFDH